MESALQVFSYKGAEIRIVEINGESWFVGKDVATVLGYQRTADAITAHVDVEDRLTRCFTDSGQKRDMVVINESGVYSLIFASKLPTAKDFKHWVTSEVLPQIRKTGSYNMRPNANISPNDLECASVIFQSVGIKGNQLAIALNNMYRTYSGKNALEAGEIILEAPTKRQLLTPTEIGSHFGLKAHRVNEILAGAGFQHKINGKWEALPEGEQFAVMQDTGKKHSNGTPVRQLKWDSSIITVLGALREHE